MKIKMINAVSLDSLKDKDAAPGAWVKIFQKNPRGQVVFHFKSMAVAKKDARAFVVAHQVPGLFVEVGLGEYDPGQEPQIRYYYEDTPRGLRLRTSRL